MTVPDYQTLMASALQALADGAEQPISQLGGVIAKQIGLTDDDLKATLPSGSPLFANRLHWTITYLASSGPGPPSPARHRTDHQPRPRCAR